VASTALAKSAKTLSPAVLKIRPMVRSLGERRRGEATTLCDWAGKSVSQKRPHGWHLAKILEIAENSACQASVCRLAVTPHECRPAPDNPYYRGLSCADFTEQRRPSGADGTIGGFSPIA